MKKLIYCAAAIAMAFFAGSCQQEMLEPAAQETTVTYSVELPKLQTKAIGDGFNVNQLVYEVWKTENPNERDLKNPDAKATRLYQATAEMAKIDGEQKTIVSLNLVHDQNYTILFWAQYADNEVSPYYVTEDLTAVTYKKEVGKGGYLSNDENMAAFYITEFLTAEEIEKPGIKRIELKRPFAQLNIGTKNTAEEYEITMTESKVTIANVPTVFDVAQNTPANPAVTEEKTFVFNYAGLPTNPKTLTVNDIPYHYVAMNYIFATNNVTVTYEIDADLKAYDTGAVTEATVTNIVYEVPLKENYRTNIVGNLITSTTEYEVVIDASWDDVNAENWDGNVEEVWDEKYIQEPKMVNGVYEISLASELAWLAAKVNGIPYVDSETNSVKYNKPEKFSGKTFRLVEDIDLVGEDRDNLTWTPIGVSSEFEGVFDGNGHKISNLVVKAEGTTPAGLFGKIKKATVKDVTVENANVQGHGSAAVVVAHAVSGKIENCHVNGATVVSTPIEKDHANNVGGIVGYLSGESVGYVKDCTVTGTEENPVVITGYRKVGGIVGSANQTAEVSGNTVTNAIITADQRVEYGDVKAAEAGKIAGYKHKNATIPDTNKAVDTEVIVYIDDAAEMSGAAGDDITFIYLQDNTYDVTEEVEVDGSLQIATGNDVVINGNGNNIYAGTPDHYSFITEGNEASLVLNDVNVIANGGAIAASNAGNVTINGGSVALNATTTNPRYSIYAVGNDTEVTINGGEFSISKITLKRAYIYVGAGATVYINGGTFGKASTRDGYKTGIKGDGTVIITGGTFGFDPTKWLKHGYVAKKVDNNWVVEGPATTTDEFQAALKDAKPGDVVYVTGSGVMPSSLATSTPGELTIEGVSEDSEVSFNTQAGSADGGLNCYAEGMDLVFKNIKIVSPNTGSAYSGGFGRAKSVTFINCEYVGQYRAGSATTKFIDCTIDPQTSYIYTDYANVDFEDCEFNCSEGKGVQVYNDGNSSETVVNVTDCEFIAAKQGATWDNKPVTAVDINSNGEKFTVNIANSTATGFPEGLVSGETIFNIKGGAEYVTVMVDGLQWLTKDAWKDADGNVVVYSSEALQYALDNTIEGQNMIHLAADIVGNVTAVQKVGVKVVINGNGKNYDGMITVNGKSMAYPTAALTIKDLTFNATSISGDACIRLGDGTDATRYTSNVTVEKCTFAVPDAVGVKSYTGGDKNLKLSGCNATAAAHSLLQAAGIDGIEVNGCEIYSKNGMNFNQSDNVAIESCVAEVKGYAARFGASSGTTGEAETYLIKDSTLKSTGEEGDAVIVLRATADLATLTINGTTLVGTPQITNNANGAKVIIDGVQQ